MFKGNKLAEARSRLRPLSVAQGIKLAVGIVMCFLFATFWIAHRHTPHLMIQGLLLHAFAVMLIVDAARELNLLGGIDYAAPVLAIQKRLAVLTDWRVRVGQLSGILWCFLWIPLVLVVFAWLGADLWAHAQPVVYWFLASGVVGLAALLGARYVSRRSRRLNVGRFLDESSEGKSVQRARSVLEEILSFERE